MSNMIELKTTLERLESEIEGIRKNVQEDRHYYEVQTVRRVPDHVEEREILLAWIDAIKLMLTNGVCEHPINQRINYHDCAKPVATSLSNTEWLLKDRIKKCVRLEPASVSKEIHDILAGFPEK